MVDTTLAGACGLYCGACGIYRMYKDKDTERLEGTARDVFHCQLEDIRCEGCRGPVDCHWSPDCRFITCTQDQRLIGAALLATSRWTFTARPAAPVEPLLLAEST
jgi:hypothetical protein